MQKGRGGSWMLARSQDNPAISWFDSASVREGLRLYRIKPRTGKTHQIRGRPQKAWGADLGG